MGFGNRLQEVRKKHSITQKDLAKSLGIVPQSLSQYEKDKLSFTLKFRNRLLTVFTKEEVDYIEHGDTVQKPHSQTIVGNNNHLVGRDSATTTVASTGDTLLDAIVAIAKGLDESQKIEVLSCINRIKNGS